MNSIANFKRVSYSNLSFEAISDLLEIIHLEEILKISSDLEGFNTPYNSPQKILLRTSRPHSKEELLAFFENFHKKTYRIKGFAHIGDGMVLVDGVRDRISFQKNASRYWRY